MVFSLVLPELGMLFFFPWIIIAQMDSNSASVMPLDPSFGSANMMSYRSDYGRSGEVDTKCSDFNGKSSPGMLHEPGNAQWRIQNELSFRNGDWMQDLGSAPLLPYLFPRPFGNETIDNSTQPMHITSLWITDVNIDKNRDSARLSAVLKLAINAHRGLSYMDDFHQEFTMYPTTSILTVLMEGIYTESNDDRRICMLGCTSLPKRSSNQSDPWSDFALGKQDSVTKSCDLMLRMQYPKELSLTSRDVQGSFTSFSTNVHFDKVSMSSQLGAYSIYQFNSGNLVETACADKITPPLATELYKEDHFCATLEQILSGESQDIMPNWQCRKSQEFCSRAGPFEDYSGGMTPGGHILLQDVRCVDFVGAKSELKANVSAVLRVVDRRKDQHLTSESSALDGLTLAAEGLWESSTGQLCMVGCLGGEKDRCIARICSYIPLTLSLKQRSIFVGSISSVNSGDSFYPLTFYQTLYPRILPAGLANKLTYRYSRSDQAGAILEREVPSTLGDKVILSLLKYPTQDKGRLSQDLTVHSGLISHDDAGSFQHQTSFLSFDIIAVEDVMSLDWSSYMSPESAPQGETGPLKKAEFVKVAAEMTLSGRNPSDLPAISAEGLYNPKTGKMYLVACKLPKLSWKGLNKTDDLELENGLDCLVEMIVTYPPTNARWMVSPTVTLEISSKRNGDDPFFFKTIKLETFPILYSQQLKEIVSRKNLEEILSIFTLSLMILCIISQLWYVRKNPEPVPYVSLILIAVQAIGYSIPLITGAEALFARLTSDGNDDARSDVIKDGELSNVILYFVKLLTLIAFLLVLRLCQKVVKYRIRLSTRFPLEPRRVPSDKKVLRIFALIHFIGFCLVLIIHSVLQAKDHVKTATIVDWKGAVKHDIEWMKELKEYGGLVQDLFLLPQVIGGMVWEIRGKPLRRTYYIGLTLLRLLPHAYDAVRAPIFNPYFADESVFANPRLDFYSRAGDISIPLLALVLAIVVYIQQRWNDLRWKVLVKSGSSKLMRLGSKMYERLPSKTFEAELMPNLASLDEIEPSDVHHIKISS